MPENPYQSPEAEGKAPPQTLGQWVVANKLLLMYAALLGVAAFGFALRFGLFE